ncbi:MAG: manganese efflux pump MntP family protein [Rhodospirillales bacterium]
MTIATSVALGVSLSIDSFAAALGKGAGRQRISVARVFGIAACFGLVEGAIMAAGWLSGALVNHLLLGPFVSSVDHWIAFALLALIGFKMVREGLSNDPAAPRGHGRLVATAVATSIDAAAVGFTLPFAGIPLVEATAVVALSTFVLAVAGAWLGRIAGPLLGRRAEILGGVVLLAVGAKILAEHLAA